MKTISWRLTALVFFAALTVYITNVLLGHDRLAWFGAACALWAGLCFFFALDCGIIEVSYRQEAFGHLLHLRSHRDHAMVGYCGYQDDYLAYFEKNVCQPERVYLVATCHESGRIYAAEPPARHHNVLWLMGEYDDKASGKENQGFVTTWGRWVGREEAWAIAERHEQLLHREPNPGTLYSENLWAGPMLSHQMLQASLERLVDEAYRSNKVITIELHPTLPLAMGEYAMVPHVRESLPLIRHRMAQERKAKEV